MNFESKMNIFIRMKNNRIHVVAVIMLLMLYAIKSPVCLAGTTQVEVVNEIGLDHSQFGDLLKKHVSATGAVNYAGLKKDVKLLDEYLKLLSSNVPASNVSKNTRLAYWMNAYNAFTIKLIINKYPVASIKDISEKPWDIKFIQLGGKTYNLNAIEHDILRKMGDPRIHVGINCASVSCPRLLNRAFTTENVNVELDKLTKGFIKDRSRNQITPNDIKLSKIFSWFKADFTKKGSLIDWINKYSEVKVKSTAKVSYLKYDWNLNK
jgi:hypothetical protein